MNHRVKSLLYFASFVIVALVYNNIENADTVQNTEMANNTIEHVSTVEALN